MSYTSFSFWIVVLTTACVVIGYCWPVFAQFRGGMGLACAGGGLLVVIAYRFLMEWNRRYQELWLDRKKSE